MLSYATYLGGSREDWGFGIAVDATGAAYVTGVSCSVDFSKGSATQTASITGAFVANFTPEGDTLVYCTALGGSFSYGIAVDAAGNAYATGEGFVAKLNATGNGLVYFKNFDGSEGAEARGIAVDAAGNAYVTGIAGDGFPTVHAVQRF